MVDMLKSIGIEKGKPFNPDTKTQELHKSAAIEAHDWFVSRFETGFKPYFEGTQWATIEMKGLYETWGTFYEKQDMYVLDDRRLTFYYIFGSVKELGSGQYYMFTIKNKQGEFLEGGNSYRLPIPANPPVHQCWSIVIYDRSTHTLIREVDWFSRSSKDPNVKQNPDGTVDIYFWPKAPAGKEANWIPTNAGMFCEVCFRFYGPEKQLFDTTWRLLDVEKVK